MAGGVLGLISLSLNPLAWLFSQPLEIWYDQSPTPQAPAQAIVVLSGSVDPPRPNRPYALAAHDTYVRVQHAAWLFKHWNAVPVLACGGGPDDEPYSKTMRHLLESGGVPADLIWTESQSQSTYENALYGAEILRRHGVSTIALVTDARSMPRAAASFRKQGLTVVPAPMRFHSLELRFEHILPTWKAIQSNGETVHELVGLLWYWVRGRV
jgi:uncharacterized SAM-binding protein YcdF (DUF218 family)